MANYFSSGFPTVTGKQLAAGSSIPGSNPSAARTPVDTGLASSVSPQTGAIVPGTLPIPSGSEAVTAKAGGTKAAAVQLTYGVNEITVCATAANSVLLPYAFPGAVCFIANDGAQSTTIYGRGTDTIDAVATATGNAMAAAKRGYFVGIAGTGDGTDAGAWLSFVGAKTS